MWIFIQDGQEHLLIPGKIYNLGRGARTSEQGNVDFQCPEPYVSKLQLTISVDQPSLQEIQDPEQISRLVIQDVGQGKVHYSGKMYKTKKEPIDIPVEYSHGSVALQLGNLNKEHISLQFKWTSMVLWYSKSDNESRLEELFHLARSLDIRLVTNYVDNVTIFLQGSQHTSKLAKALIKAIPVVKFEFLRVLFERKGKLEDSFELPNVENYVPEPAFRFIRGRNELFEGLHFLISRKDLPFLDFVTLAKGNIVDLDLEDRPEVLSERYELKKLDPRKIVCFKPTNELETEDQHQKMRQLASYLGVKVVGNPQIMESILKVDSSILLTNEPLHLDKKRPIGDVSTPETNSVQPKRSRFKRREIKPLDAMELLSQQVVSQHEKTPVASVENVNEPSSIVPFKKESRFRRNRTKQVALEEMIDVSQTSVPTQRENEVQGEAPIEEVKNPVQKPTSQRSHLTVESKPPIQENKVVESSDPVKEPTHSHDPTQLPKHEPLTVAEHFNHSATTTTQILKPKAPLTYKFSDSQLESINPNTTPTSKQKLSSMIMQAKELKLKETLDDDIQELLEETTKDTREKLKIHSDNTIFRERNASVKSHMDKSPFHPEWKGRVNYKKFKRKDSQGSLISTRIYVPLINYQVDKETEKTKILTKELEFLNEMNQPIQELDSQFTDVDGKHKGKRLFVMESDQEEEIGQFESRRRTRARPTTTRDSLVKPEMIDSEEDEDDEPKFRFTTPS